jgi:type IV secretory pathway VirD2 relaxase
VITRVRRTVVRHRYVPAGKGLKGKLWDALSYMQQRPLGKDEQEQDRHLFTAHTEGLSRHEARALLLEHADRQVAYHRLILSPGAPVADLQRWTRLVMTDLSRHLGQELHWVAAVHQNTAHPHVHLLLAGTGERLINDGRSGRILLRPDEHAVLRESGDRHARELAREERGLEEAIRTELDLLVAGMARVLVQEIGEEGPQSHKHLAERHEQRGAPGRDATRGR